jgi:hypothetical protein
MKSATTASTQTPLPAMKMPVWPVARKSASTTAFQQARGERERGVHLADRAVGADREQPLAAALAAAGNRDIGRRYADVHQAPPAAPGRFG